MSQYESYPKGPDGQQNPYGQPNPYDPSAYGSPASAGTVARPPSVALAVKLIFGAVALSVVSAVIALLTIDDQVRAQAETAGVDPDTVRTIALVTVLVVVVLTVVIFTVLALLINRGKNWARIVYTILGALSVLSLGTSFNGEVIAASLVVEIVQALLTIGAIVLLFRDEARPFFASR
ncbi:hypothetical protein [uncultured Nocardioides sp.]|uniref:hypothetical protein n=1 Tax=uncultured Nocardioides sp. TaxID=198441 RepID=UPI002634296A|nr:hypothetical protein [uncultured Nocardioides sp.]